MNARSGFAGSPGRACTVNVNVVLQREHVQKHAYVLGPSGSTAAVYSANE